LCEQVAAGCELIRLALTFHGVYIIKMVEISGAKATAAEQIGHSFVDVVAKVIFGIFIWAIIAAISKVVEKAVLLQPNP